MKRTIVAITAILALTLAATAMATPMHALVKQRSTDRGKLLVGSGGRLLYVYAPDKHKTDRCIKVPGCILAWPPVTTKRKPRAGAGVRGKWLGTIRLPNGKQQVTYRGRPLYYYNIDAGDGNTSYIGVNLNGGAWWAIRANGRMVK